MVSPLQIPAHVRRPARAAAACFPMTIPALTLALLCTATAGCVLYTQSINGKPSVFIVQPTGPFVRDTPITITANVSDPDGDPVRLEWSKAKGKCLPSLDLSQRPPTIFQSPPGDPTYPLMFTPEDGSTVCVWVLATDPQGATAYDATTVSLADRPPVAVINVLEPTATLPNGLYPLYSTFHLSGASSSDPDGDDLTKVPPQWTIVAMPPAATPHLVRCPSAMPTDFLQCLDVGGYAGVYSIMLTVNDGVLPGMMTTTLMVDNDHPACVSKTDPSQAASPLVLDPGESRTLTVTEILDDGSPLPTPVEGTHAPPTFAWTLSRNGGTPATIAGYDKVNALTLQADTYATGDTVVVSVTISDGVAMHLEPACDPGCPAGCPQSAQWTVEYR
jgi:hypothetical protein